MNVYRIATWYDYIPAYQREGIMVIPNHGSDKNPKSLGYDGWEDETREYPIDRLMFEIEEENKCSALLGVNKVNPAKPIFAADIDFVKCLCDNTNHVTNSSHSVECIELARKFRREHIEDFRTLQSEITFSPRGGVHVWVKASDKSVVSKWLSPFFKNLDSRIFIEEIKGKARQVLLPPSRIWVPELGKYCFYNLMDMKGVPYLENDLRIRELP